MKHVNFNEYKAMVNLTAIKDYCRENGRLCHYAKGETIVRQGAVGKYLGVIESGYFKYITITTDGNEAVVGFAFEGECVCDFNNSFRSLPSEVSIVAGSETIVWQVSFKVVQDLIENRLTGFHERVTDALFREIYHRHLELYRKSPTERYLELLNHHPDIFDIVTMREIASYLLVTPIYLSRIRKKLSENGRT
ncbi:Crp/Fnr family transcriptional regulator [Duncaniella dubosii]|jgi:CRP-like cAMP-binding protein|uniref:Crp/Fnr family transcriptional regulator n=1 Tax=Duncaniella dubosii TaxID=2518971 RepID=UPI0025B21C2E|nr:Crp/Fnr family transcriptional regulator [uncultured Duncaniella sp.]